MVDAKFHQTALRSIQNSVDFWVHSGGTYVPLPWIVPRTYTGFTKPEGWPSLEVSPKFGDLVSSGEQAFLQLLDSGDLESKDGLFVGWTPCFRAEPHFDDLHHLYFLKSELFMPSATMSQAMARARHMAQTSALFMSNEAAGRGYPGFHPELVQIDTYQVDVVGAGIELGSYGARQFRGTFYAYGTALAEPRFSNALDRTVQG